MKKLTVQASLDELATIQDALSQMVEENNGSMRAGFQLELALEEMYVNIVKYAYGDSTDENVVEVEMDYDTATGLLGITLIDSGIAFNPLEKQDVDVEELGDSGQIGGLGIHLVKETMDQVEYRRQDNKNIFTFRKTII